MNQGHKESQEGHCPRSKPLDWAQLRLNRLTRLATFPPEKRDMELSLAAKEISYTQL